MKRLVLFAGLSALFSFPALAQSYGDYFTTYKSNPVQQGQQHQTTNRYNNVHQNDVMDASRIYQSTAPKNIQTTTGVYIKNNGYQGIK